MDSGPPLNLSTSVKVEDSIKADKEVGNELLKLKQNNGDQEFVLIEPTTNEKETLTITGEVIVDYSMEEEGRDAIKVTDNSLLVASNIKSYGGKIKNYKCAHCSESFHRATQLRTHEKSHSEEKVHECDQCSEMFTRLSLLVQHRQEHAKKFYSCSECNITLHSFSTYRIHMKKHKCERRFKCSECSMSFAQQSHLITHVRKHTGEKPFVCPICNTRFKQVSHLTTHVRIHTNDRPYTCEVCNASFSQTGSLKRHKRSHTGEKPFKCTQCHAVFVEKRNLNRHLLSHSGVRPFKCDLCLASFTQLIDLKRHKLSHSGIKPYKCDICEAAFSRKNNLKWHKLTHEGNTPHICEICNVGFRIARDLKSHKRTHIENKPYSCNQCKASFAQSTTLKRHLLVHSGNKPYSCPNCKATFFEKSALKRHLQRHGTAKPFPCEYCLTSFIEARALKRHKIVVHKEGEYDEPEGRMEMDDEKSGNANQNESVSSTIDEETNLEIYEPTYQKLDKQVVTSLPKNNSENLGIPSQNVSQIFVNDLPPESNSQMPTLIITQPGHPPKTGKPANNCQNHSSHVHTFFEGSYNHWQTWCFCEPQNLPKQGGAEAVVLTNSNAQPVLTQSQCLEFNNTIAANSFHPQQNIGDVTPRIETTMNQEPIQCSLPHPNALKCEPLAENEAFNTPEGGFHTHNRFQHYEGQEPYHTNVPMLPNGASQLLNNATEGQPFSTETSSGIFVQNGLLRHEMNSFSSDTENRVRQNESETQPKVHPIVFNGISSIENIRSNTNDDAEMCHNSKIQANMKVMEQVIINGVPTLVPSLNSQEGKEILGTYVHDKSKDFGVENSSSPSNIALPVLYDDDVSRNNAKQEVTVQYSLTVSNPATGDIQIQSDAFSAKATVSEEVKPPIKKRKVIKNSSQERQLQCPYCNKGFVKQGPLDMHIRTHTGEKPFICGICQQHFSHNNSLTIHMRSHTGERPYTCAYCCATFTQKSNLRVHHRTHTGEKPFKCDICEATFSQGSHLKAHIRIHSNDRPYACQVCGQAFTQKSALKRHHMKHTGVKPHTCTECNAKFSQKDDLKRHTSCNHGQNAKPKTTKSNKKKKSSESTDATIGQKVTDTESVANQEEVNDGCPPEQTSLIMADSKDLIVPESGDKVEKVVDISVKNEVKSWNAEIDEKVAAKVARSKKVVSVEPTRISRRIKEAAEKKKQKVENSDFITGNLDEIDEAEELEEAMLKKENSKIDSDGVVKSWCFCEVPHGPDEPHTHIESLKSEQKVRGKENVVATSSDTETILQFGLEPLSHAVVLQGNEGTRQSNPSTNQLSVNSQNVLNSGTNSGISSVEIITSNDREGTESNHTNTSQDSSNQVSLSENVDGKSLYSTAQVISGQVLSGGQFITADGAFYIEAGDIINNGGVVLNSSPGTFYFDLMADGQYVNVPVTGNLSSDHQVIVPGTTIVEASGNVYTSSSQSTSSAITFSSSLSSNVLDGNQQPTLLASAEDSILTTHPSNEQRSDSTEGLHYTSLDNNEMMLFNPTVNLQPLNVAVKQKTKPAKMKSSGPFIVNPCKCSACGKVFAQRVTLKVHMDQSHPDLHLCTICFDAFTSKEHLLTHKLLHQANVLACQECGQTFSTKNALSQHRQKIHKIGRYAGVKKEQRAFMCDRCDSRFCQISDLKRHMLGHTGEKPFTCEQCGAGFTRKFSLKKHERIHTGEKPYLCKDCDQSFAYRHQYNRHCTMHNCSDEPKVDNDSALYSQVIE